MIDPTLAYLEYKEFKNEPELLTELLIGFEAESAIAKLMSVVKPDDSTVVDVSVGATSLISAIASALGVVLKSATTSITYGARLLFGTPQGLALTVIAGGSYGLYKLMTHEPQPTTSSVDGTTVDPKSKVKALRNNLGILDTIVQGSTIVGIDPQLMIQLAKAESAYGTHTVSQTSQAQGMYQIIPATWRSHYKQFKELYGVPKDDPRDPLSATIFSAAYIKHVLAPKLGYSPSATDIYMMYVFGPTGGKALLDERQKDPQQPAAAVHGAKGEWAKRQIRANRNYFYNSDGSLKTVEQVYQKAKSAITLTKDEAFTVSSYVGDRPTVTNDVEQEVVSTDSIVGTYGRPKDYQWVKRGNMVYGLGD